MLAKRVMQMDWSWNSPALDYLEREEGGVGGHSPGSWCHCLVSLPGCIWQGLPWCLAAWSPLRAGRVAGLCTAACPDHYSGSC